MKHTPADGFIDIKPPLLAEAPAQSYWLPGIIAVLACLVFYLLRNKKKQVLVEQKPDYEKELEKELKLLKQQVVDNATASSAVSVALRHYLGEKLGFSAHDMTKNEVVESIEITSTPEDFKQSVSEVLGKLEEVSFSPHASMDVAEISNRIEKIREEVSK